MCYGAAMMPVWHILSSGVCAGTHCMLLTGHLMPDSNEPMLVITGGYL